MKMWPRATEVAVRSQTSTDREEGVVVPRRMTSCECRGSTRVP